MNLNMYGILYTGSLICGKKQKSIDEDLCVKWAIVGAFMPIFIEKTEIDLASLKNYKFIKTIFSM